MRQVNRGWGTEEQGVKEWEGTGFGAQAKDILEVADH